jgi:hypothetical protein
MQKYYNAEKTNIQSINLEQAKLNACSNGHLLVAQWLCTLKSNYKMVVENDKIIAYTI